MDTFWGGAQRIPGALPQTLPGTPRFSEVSKRGWRTEGVGARKSLPNRKFRPFSAPFFLCPCEYENTILGDIFCCILGDAGRQPPPANPFSKPLSFSGTLSRGLRGGTSGPKGPKTLVGGRVFLKIWTNSNCATIIEKSFDKGRDPKRAMPYYCCLSGSHRSTHIAIVIFGIVGTRVAGQTAAGVRIASISHRSILK